jgi:hypothetical protein
MSPFIDDPAKTIVILIQEDSISKLLRPGDLVHQVWFLVAAKVADFR